MNISSLKSSEDPIDPMGKAIHDYYFSNLQHSLLVLDHLGPAVPMDVGYYFRNFNRMPILEKEALRQCAGKILDIGAGAGSHSLYLQKNKLQVTALDISLYNVEVMISRGLKKVVHQNIWEHDVSQYDTLLFMMNGLGFTGSIQKLQKFLRHLYKNTKASIQIIADSSDVYYLFEDRPHPDHYYGEITCKYNYGPLSSPWFEWLYIDEGYLNIIAQQTGWDMEIIERDTDRQFLVRLTKQ